MTYNVHRCVGPGGRDSIADITSVCKDAGADIIALQELDAPETDQDEGAHHARDLADHLGMELMFCRTFRRGVGYYGPNLYVGGINDGCLQQRVVDTRRGPRLRTVNVCAF